ncbi:precorrin-2 methylase [Enterococcus sp. PF1-24]|uniref:hypothetical protein n=1 Tax=unclassified Enterococcus TaxID=2608891 RepID=UPI002475B6B3|nr:MULTISPECIES: hypothetical protein [unclassified Enterococcus]MDH6364523.1 precorrin-2 methylase [Enterococcus sp. PFB1-1]MDH6401600.1 precorrin-2 methylase [Enterococcus sp. PF1-24]
MSEVPERITIRGMNPALIVELERVAIAHKKSRNKMAKEILENHLKKGLLVNEIEQLQDLASSYTDLKQLITELITNQNQLIELLITKRNE